MVRSLSIMFAGLGIILLAITFSITVALRFFQRLGRSGTAGTP